MRSKIMFAVLALGTLVAVPAFAEPSQGGKGERKHFPMAADAFRQHVDTRMAKARAKVEERAAALPAEEGKALRAKFAASLAQVNAEVAKAVADGTVTKEEAKAVRAVSPRGGKGGGHCDKKDGASQKS